jgi:hypothetical protein
MDANAVFSERSKTILPLTHLGRRAIHRRYLFRSEGMRTTPNNGMFVLGNRRKNFSYLAQPGTR